MLVHENRIRTCTPPSQSGELTTALTRDGIYTKIPHYEDNFE